MKEETELVLRAALFLVMTPGGFGLALWGAVDQFGDDMSPPTEKRLVLRWIAKKLGWILFFVGIVVWVIYAIRHDL